MELSESKKKRGQYCCAYACRNKPVAKLGGLCYKHYRRRVRERDPVYCRYNNFKGNAKKRKKDFTITLSEFRAFCNRTGYIIKKGRRGQNATIDRRCNAQGYHIWNIQLLSNSENARKGQRYNEDKDRFKDPRTREQIEDDCPF